MRTASVTAAAMEPSPEPNTRPIRGRKLVRSRMNCAACSARRKSSVELFPNLFQAFLGFKGSHASGSRSSYRLPITAVGDVTADEYTGHSRTDILLWNQIPVAIASQLFADKLGVGCVP